jgi:hypothetical protein
MKSISLPIALLLTTVGSAALSQEFVAATRGVPAEANMYATTEVPSVTRTLERPCTQLELTARVPADDCGKLALDEVAQVYFERTTQN